MTREDIKLIGGTNFIAEKLGIRNSAVSMWFKDHKEHGRIPYKHAKVILELAQKYNAAKDWTLDYIIGE